MKALFDAIFVKYAASDLPNLLTELYNTEAEEPEFPYAVVQMVVGSAIDYATGESKTDDWLVQFNLFEKGPNMNVILDAYATLTAAFDSTTLAVSGYNFLSCRRPPGSVLQTKEEGVWQINCSYRIKVRAI